MSLKELFGALCFVCQAQTIFGGKPESVSEHSQLLMRSGLITEKNVILHQYLLLFYYYYYYSSFAFVVLLRL